MRAEQRPELRILFVAIESAGAREQVVEGVLRVPQLEPIAAHRGLPHVANELRIVAQELRARTQPQLGVSRRPVVIDAKHASRNPLSLERHALRVPERRDGIHLSRGERRHCLKADGHAMNGGWIGSAALEYRVQHRVVRGQAGDPDRSALEVSRRVNGVARDHSGEGPLHYRHHARPRSGLAHRRSPGRGCRGWRTAPGRPRAASARRWRPKARWTSRSTPASR